MREDMFGSCSSTWRVRVGVADDKDSENRQERVGDKKREGEERAMTGRVGDEPEQRDLEWCLQIEMRRSGWRGD